MEPLHPENGPYSDLYREFIDFIRVDIQRERQVANRRMMHVLIWCFLVPAAVSVVLILLIKLGVLPRRIHRHLDWLIVVFPVAYALYMLSLDFLKDAPVAFRRGGIAATLGRVLDEEKWRARVCRELQQKFLSSPTDQRIQGWKWIIENFQIDLQNVQNRTRYLTALAGAVFFLIFQGIDTLDGPRPQSAWSTSSIMGWFEASSSSLTQFVGLGIFLILLYVSGNQVYVSLMRYLYCARLVLPEEKRMQLIKDPFERDSKPTL